MREYPTLEEELEAGRITQEEYDSLTGGISEETYQQEISAEEETELSPRGRACPARHALVVRCRVCAMDEGRP